MDMVEELRADELPGERQSKREARMELGKLLDRAADEIERLRRMTSPRGCICPPTSEQTCKSPMCPRRGFEGVL